jgi:type IV secretion system protein VirB9
MFGTIAIALMVTGKGWTENYGVDVVAEAKQWQRNGSARPVRGKDGLILFPFGQYQPVLTCAPLFACEIALEPGESIKNVVSGDTIRWIVAKAESGEGQQLVKHVFVKPTETGISTNLSITTNRRVYVLTLKSTKGNDYVSRVGFYYPEAMVQNWSESERKTRDQAPVATFPGLAPDQLKFNYRFRGDKSLPWYPVQAFSDASHVYIQMSEKMKASEAPALILLDGNTTQLVNYRVSKGYFIVDKIFDQAALIVGVGSDQKRVDVIRDQGFFERLWTNRTSGVVKMNHSEPWRESFVGFAVASEHRSDNFLANIELEGLTPGKNAGKDDAVWAGRVEARIPLGEVFDLAPAGAGSTDPVFGASMAGSLGGWIRSPDVDFGLSFERSLYESSRFGGFSLQNSAVAKVLVKANPLTLTGEYRMIFNKNRFGSDVALKASYENEDFRLSLKSTFGCYGKSVLCSGIKQSRMTHALGFGVKLVDSWSIVGSIAYTDGSLVFKNTPKYNGIFAELGAEIKY